MTLFEIKIRYDTIGRSVACLNFVACNSISTHSFGHHYKTARKNSCVRLLQVTLYLQFLSIIELTNKYNIIANAIFRVPSPGNISHQCYLML